MKAIIIATLITLAVAGTITIFLRRRTSTNKAAMMFKIYLIYIPILMLVWFNTPENLGFLHEDLLSRPRALDLLASLFFFSAAFFGGILQLYNLADRGFSLRILIELNDALESGLTTSQLAPMYSDGKGLLWMYDKRLEGMVQHGLINVLGDRVVLTSRGWFWAGLFAAARNFLRLEKT